MREALLFCFNLKKSATESHRMLVEAYDDNALLETTCRDWFRQFNDDNFDLSDKKRENWPRKVENCQLQALLDEDDTQSQKIACRAIGCFSSSHFHAATCHGEGSKDRKMGAAKLNDRQMERRQKHAKFCLPDKKKVVPASDCDKR